MNDSNNETCFLSENPPIVRRSPRLNGQNGGFCQHFVKKTKEDDNTRKQVKQVIVMLITLVIVFISCWGPILINNVLAAFGVVTYLHIGELKPMRQAFYLLSYMNSCINPFIYGFMSKNFRMGFMQASASLCRRNRHRLRAKDMSYDNTRQTAICNTAGEENISLTRCGSSFPSNSNLNIVTDGGGDHVTSIMQGGNHNVEIV